MEQKKLLFADYMRVLATLAVILLHCAGDYLYQFKLGGMDTTRWWICNIYDSSVRWCVPIFVMLSGALLLRPKKVESIPDFLKKRMLRVFIPFLFWGFIYTCYVNRAYIYDVRRPYWPDVWFKVFFEDIYYHLWFVPMILGLYFLVPVFRVFVRHATKFEQEYFLMFWFYVSTIQIYFPHFFLVKFIGWLAYIGYLVLGDYLVTYGFPEKDKRWLYILGWFSLLMTIGATWQVSANFGIFSEIFYQYLSPNVIFMAFALFVWMRDYDWASFSTRFPRIQAFVQWFSGISFGVYLVHVILLDIFKNGYLFDITFLSNSVMGHQMHVSYGIPLVTLFITIVSISIIYVLCKIPYLRDWVK